MAAPSNSTPAISTPALGFFRRIVTRYFSRHFHGVRICGLSRLNTDANPLIVYANHASWWDPMVLVLLAGRLMPERSHYAPMDAESLARYRILSKIGIFPVEMNTGRGALQFLRTSAAILKSGGVLWVTPEGRFVDAHARPLEFKPGLALLASNVASALGTCTLLPLAVEYVFWDERLPEALLRFGKPILVSAGKAAEEIEPTQTAALEETMDELRTLAANRNPRDFATLSRGSEGAGGFYALGKRLQTIMRRRTDPTHPATPALDDLFHAGKE